MFELCKKSYLQVLIAKKGFTTQNNYWLFVEWASEIQIIPKSLKNIKYIFVAIRSSYDSVRDHKLGQYNCETLLWKGI